MALPFKMLSCGMRRSCSVGKNDVEDTVLDQVKSVVVTREKINKEK